MNIPHFDKVDLNNISAKFTADGMHRSLLEIPLLNRTGKDVICIIGQNPSTANAQHADKTLYYLEKYVYEKLPQYSKIIMLNLYSRVDTTKSATDDLLTLDCERVFRRTIQSNRNFLIVFGKLKKQGAYRFEKKAALLKKQLKGKNIYKIGIGTSYAPHPGNRLIHYSNYSLPVVSHSL
ncbi:DUF1643 domain-containing protein [Plesiomonas shigelloides]|uniref:DUF1643 domain-containing protein n=1 Tax=Plesiomonas shigelloides TaxID=703 RepID=UPI0030BBAB95